MPTGKRLRSINLRSITSKISGTFALLVVLSGLTGGFAILKVDQVSAIGTALARQVEAVTLLGDLARLSQQLRALTALQHYGPPGGTQRSAYAQEAEDSRIAFSKAWGDYTALVEGARETQLAETLRTAWQHFLAVEEEILILDKAGLTETGTAVLQGDMLSEAASFYAAARAVQAYRQQEVEAATAAAQEIRTSARFWILAALACLLALCTLAGWLLTLTISKPIGRMTTVMGRLADDDIGVEVPEQRRRDEIGQMAVAVQVFKDNMIRNKALEAEVAAQRAGAEEQRRVAMRQMADVFDQSVGGIVTAVSSAAVQMQTTARLLSVSAEATSARAVAVSAATEEASVNIQSIAGAAEELDASVTEIGVQVERSSAMSQAAVREAEGVSTLVNELTGVATSIGDVVDTIASLAGQTNLLALNATIEAARAGEAGRGFAVVASEVKELANQTSRAAGEITAKIEAIQSSTGRTASAIGGISISIRSINETSTAIASAVEEQGAATREIVQAIAQASSGIGEVTANITGVASNAEETGTGASQVLGASDDVAQHSDQLRRQVQSFLDTVRAA
ncbi:methyl-accepting chemotaxis protein [Methylorubrum extorquens]|uniref:methyl-accepting chemotaxis protein n=1 Tax=Methylorubrum extorquens TaxID=408 RepID=UPI0020A01A0C|nr:methyl-accepting chemotaxis protein [Methylorubrum extorquens]MCP1535774.1 methyl-accepting chemotaxis protein [Methylorubrum extorquens]